MTIVQLRRLLRPGLQLRLVRSLLGACNKLRTVVKVRSRDIVFRTEEGNLSYCRLPKRDQLVETERGFRFLEDGETAVEYEYL